MTDTPPAPSFIHLDITTDGAVGYLVLSNGKKLNPLGPDTLAEIAEAAHWFDAQDSIKVVIIRGSGRVFSAGADLANFNDGQHVKLNRNGGDQGRIMAEAVENMSAITIASIHGWCVGGGLVLAAACDLRLATAETQFSIPEVDLGIPLAWGGIPRLVREIGPALCKELVLTCRPFDAAEAKAAGFLNRVVSAETLEQETQALAEQLSAKALLPLLATKRHVNAVTAQAFGTADAWSDASGLVAALADEECSQVRRQYLRDRKASRRQ